MKLETKIDGRAGTLEIRGDRFRYQREGGEAVEGEFSMHPLEPGIAVFEIDGRVYRVALGAPGERVVNGVPMAVEVIDPRAYRSSESSGAAQGRANIAAAMPGKVVRVLAAAGEEVEAGQGLVVVEAMKMQNEMKSPKAGRVVEVRTKPGSAVAAGEVLMVVE